MTQFHIIHTRNGGVPFQVQHWIDVLIECGFSYTTEVGGWNELHCCENGQWFPIECNPVQFIFGKAANAMNE